MSALAAAATGTTPLSGTLVVVGLIIACIGLFFALNRSLRKVPKSFGPPPARGRGASGDPAEGTDSADSPAQRPAGVQKPLDG